MSGLGDREIATERARWESELAAKRSDAWTDLGLTLPIFLFYHLAVVTLPVRNAADGLTEELRTLASNSLTVYAGLTLGIGALFAGVLIALGRGHAFDKSRFVRIFVEGAIYAVAMRFAGSYVVGSMTLGPTLAGSGPDPFTGLVMSAGAGFYEEVAFRVALFGGGAFVLRLIFGRGVLGLPVLLGWALFGAIVFSAWHYIGPTGDPFALSSFLFRVVCGLVLTAIYELRGFAPAVWTHFLYDVWVLVL